MPTDTRGRRGRVVLLDTSAAIALVVEDHEGHAATLETVHGCDLGLAGHAWFETFSVLTRLPPRLRRSPADVARALGRNFPASRFLDEAASRDLGRELSSLGIAGGAVYDALVGAAARQHRLPLMSRDARARRVYEALGVEVELIQ